jgi:CheY-like chemotaxis protein
MDVADSGIGIPPDVLDKIFEPFFTTKDVNKGTGLGLSTVISIVKSHEGFVNVYTELGKGTVFSVYLPAIDTSTQSGSIRAQQTGIPRGLGETILVVDDEASILTITGQTLQTYGYHVLTARDGAEAVTLYSEKRHEIALVVTDIMMPVMDGTTAINAFARMNPNVKVIAVSGLNTNRDAISLSDVRVKSFLLKPYSARTLLVSVRQALDGP